MEDLGNLKVGVLGGGVSLEREISLISAQEVFMALQRRKIETVFIDISTSHENEIKELVISKNIDIAFIALHGEFGEDGKIQKIMEDLDMPYTGSRPKASYQAMDKIASKNIFLKRGVPTAYFSVCYDINKVPKNLSFPLVVKPYFTGSSIGVSIVDTGAGLKIALEKAFSYQNKVILESYIEGKELTVGILEEKPLAVVEIIPKKGYFDFQSKYTDGLTEFITPANLRGSVYRRVQEIALAAHCVLGCRHFSRVDIRLSKEGIPYVLEVNSIPGLTSHSLLPLSAKHGGIEFDELIFKMLMLANNEKRQAQKI